MLARVPDCHFTSEDIAFITKETGLEPTAIRHWASNLRWKCANNGFGHDVGSVQEYLEASQESLDEKVISHTPMKNGPIFDNYAFVFRSIKSRRSGFSCPCSALTRIW
jgi:hypothetical protein